MSQRLGRDRLQRPLEVVDGLDQIFGEGGDREGPRGRHVSLGALLQVDEVGARAQVPVLEVDDLPLLGGVLGLEGILGSRCGGGGGSGLIWGRGI